MLYEEGVSAIGKKMTVAAVISHEIAHQVRIQFQSDDDYSIFLILSGLAI